MLQEPQLSNYDWQFRLLGFPVRVAWGFWILAAILGWNQVSMIDYAYANAGRATPGTFPLLIVFAFCLFLSILIHELGHAFLFRNFGSDCRIVLYHFGGLAIPGAFTDWNAARRRFTNRPQDLIAISAAGPAIQFLVGVLAWGVATAFHVETSLTRFLLNFVELPLPPVQMPDSATVYIFFETFVYVSVFWSLLNLLPIMPLDGGQIMRELLRINGSRNPINTAAMASMIVCGLVALLAFQNGFRGGGIMCIALLASNYQLYQASRYGSF